jgi:hypothetical protein
LFRCHSTHFIRSLGCLESFSDVEHILPPLTWLSLPAWLPQEPSDLSRLEPGSSSWDLAYFECLLATAYADQPHRLAITRTIWSEWTRTWWPPLSCLWPPLMCSCFLASISREPFDLSGFSRDNPFSFHANSPLSSPEIHCRTINAYCMFCTLFILCLLNDSIFCKIVSLLSLLAEHIITVFLILEMYSRYFEPKISNIICIMNQ